MAKERFNRLKYIIQSFLIIIVISTVSIVIYDIYINIEVKDYAKKDEVIPKKMIEEENYVENVDSRSDFTSIIANVSECVVGISKLEDKGLSIFNLNSAQELGLGTGLIVSEDGYILTNQHVAGGKYSVVYVTLFTGEKLNGTVVWADENVDLAIIKINKNGLDYAELGDSSKTKVGQKVYAIGNPIGFEFQRTVTSGIISARERAIKIEDGVYMSDLIQTDATINQGNSGGPLILEDGRVIAINSVKISSAEGIGFAIPINVVKPIIEKLASGESFEEAGLGIFAYDKNVIPYLDSSLKFDSGIYVVDIKSGKAAEKAGVELGDIITKIDGKEINKMNELREYIYTKNPNDEVILTIMRENEELEISLILDKK